MENTMLIKNFGEVAEAKRYSLTNPSPYLSNNEMCLDGELNQDAIKRLTKEKVNNIKNNIHYMIDMVSNPKTEDTAINKLMDKLKKANSREDLIEIINVLMNECQNRLSEKSNFEVKSINRNILNIKSELENNPDVVLSIMIKKIIFTYFFDKLVVLDKNKISELEYKKTNSKNIDLIFELLDVNFTQESKDNGVYELSKIILNDVIDVVFDAKQQHLCFDCKNGHPFKCQKITDEIYQKIDQYDFITKGYQIVNERGKVDKFIVTECSNFEHEVQKKLSSKEYRRIKQLKEGIFLAYYDTDSVSEARKIRNYIQAKTR